MRAATRKRYTREMESAAGWRFDLRMAESKSSYFSFWVKARSENQSKFEELPIMG
jgi:hypothetical protein